METQRVSTARRVTTKLTITPTSWGFDYTAVIDGERRGISWYGPHLSPEGRHPNTEYVLEYDPEQRHWHIVGCQTLGK